MKLEITEAELNISSMTEKLLEESERYTVQDSDLSKKEHVVVFVNKCLAEFPKIDSLEKESYNRFSSYQEELLLKTAKFNRNPLDADLAEKVAELSDDERKSSLFHDQLFNNYEDLKRVVVDLIINHNLVVS